MIRPPLAPTVALIAAAAILIAAAQPATTNPEPEPDWPALRQELDDAMQRLAPLVGRFNAEGTMGRATADQPAPSQHGTWTNRWLMDGKHLELAFDVAVGEGDQARQTQWLAIVSYNAFRHRYESVWIGSSGYRFAETGEFDNHGRLVLTAQQDGPDADNPTTNVSIFEFHADGSITVTDTQTDLDTPEPVVSFFVRLTPIE